VQHLPEGQKVAAGTGSILYIQAYKKEWHQKSGLDIKRFFNTSGMIYREMKLKDRLPAMSLEEKYSLLSTDGMLVKRPILVTEQGIAAGFRPEEWEKLLNV